MTGRILFGGKSSFEKITKGLGEFFFERSDRHSEKILQIDALSGERETFANVKRRSIRLAISLQKLGITSEDVIVTCLKMTLDTVVPHLALLYLGAKFAGIDPIQTERDWRHCIGLVEPKLIFVDEDQVDRLKNCLGALKVEPKLIVLGHSDYYQTFEDLVLPSPEEDSFRPKVIENCRDTALILFSSGTTGSPKPMTISHFSLVNGPQRILERYGTEFFKVELLFSTFYWITSIMILIRCFFTGGCRVLFSEFHPEKTLMAIEKYKISSCLISPAIAQHLLKVENAQQYDLSSVKFYISGGTSIFPEHISRLRKLFQGGIVLNIYGSTEAGGCITGYDLKKDLDYAQSHVNTVGRILNDNEIKIIDPKSREILGPNQPGEIWLKSSYGMSGYYNNFIPSTLDSDGFFQSGDSGYYDEHDFIYINGRSNEMFKYGTLKVVPEYWESVLQNHPSIYDAGVLGIPHGSDGWLPAACIVLKEHADITTVEDIEGFFAKKMTKRHRLAGGIRFVQKLPKTPSFKLRRSQLFDVFTMGTC